MKKTYTLLIAIMCCYFGHSQTVTPNVLSNEGGFTQTAQGSIAWTIGEPISETYTTSTNITTMGFHQPELGIASLIQEQGKDQKILVYPNPVKDELTVNFSGIENGNYHLQLFDAVGKLIFKSDAEITDGNKTYRLKLNEVADGNYFLNVNNSSLNKSIKINKTK